ncbi:Predicted oxidoreductase [Pseudooceanicola antarcticus]|uniref:Aldo/keto reductase n=1 Tax=Pseudooceanicola antarcticus TaxID=1247613 RepID=A0A285IKH8_9RHOB|nr:aldo/keto reductase [Pseudooceanicola antarcticus]PJE28716.1 aldo/keto reductase [Pseudooceanicola antarcticus]SNY48452.1 Predicted oxidoreductase [Pseudooceanicola antarcticus]
MSFKQVELGRTGIMVPQLAFGAMSFGGMFGPTDEETSHACLDAAIEAGITFWDTANIYGMGVSETVLGHYLAAKKPEGITIATKASIIPGPPRRIDNSYDYLRSELEGSLEKLGLSSVELFYAHRHDPETPIEEVAETMGRLIDEGLIKGYGLSEVAPYTLSRAHAVRPVTAVQNEYSLWTRLPELGLIRSCAELGVSFVAFSPVARGMFGETSVDRADMREGDFRLSNPRFTEPNYSHNLAKVEEFRQWAHGRGVSVAGAALAWVMAQGDHVIPIPGTRTAAHLNEWLDAQKIEMDAATLAEIEAILPAGWAWGDRYGDKQMVAVERYC